MDEAKIKVENYLYIVVFLMKLYVFSFKNGSSKLYHTIEPMAPAYGESYRFKSNNLKVLSINLV